MGSIAKTRMKREIQSIKSNKDNAIQIELVDDKMDHLCGTIYGPEGTAYHKGVYKIDIVIPDNYPFEPPKAKFLRGISGPLLNLCWWKIFPL